MQVFTVTSIWFTHNSIKTVLLYDNVVYCKLTWRGNYEPYLKPSGWELSTVIPHYITIFIVKLMKGGEPEWPNP